MTHGSQLDFFVLDALANDIESLEDTLRILNSPTELGWRDQHPGEFRSDDVVPALIRGIEAGHIEVCLPGSDGQLRDVGSGIVPAGMIETFWFRLTSSGRAALNAWTPPPLSNRTPER